MREIAAAVGIAGVLVAAALALGLRWQISAATGVVYRLDRWSGEITACELTGARCYPMGP